MTDNKQQHTDYDLIIQGQDAIRMAIAEGATIDFRAFNKASMLHEHAMVMIAASIGVKPNEGTLLKAVTDGNFDLAKFVVSQGVEFTSLVRTVAIQTGHGDIADYFTPLQMCGTQTVNAEQNLQDGVLFPTSEKVEKLNATNISTPIFVVAPEEVNNVVADLETPILVMKEVVSLNGTNITYETLFATADVLAITLAPIKFNYSLGERLEEKYETIRDRQFGKLDEADAIVMAETLDGLGNARVMEDFMRQDFSEMALESVTVTIATQSSLLGDPSSLTATASQLPVSGLVASSGDLVPTDSIFDASASQLVGQDNSQQFDELA